MSTEHDLVVSYLNKRTEKDTKKALKLLVKMFNLKENVDIYFNDCKDKPVSKIYFPFRTGYTNIKRIVICHDILTDKFNKETYCKTISYNKEKVCHFVIVFLHEFGHILDKRDLLDSSYYTEQKNEERIADHFAKNFLDQSVSFN
jgi:hypothetical protein